MRHIAYALIAIVMGFFLMVPLGNLFEYMRWPHFNFWAMAHGGFVVAWPSLTLASYLAIVYVARRLRR